MKKSDVDKLVAANPNVSGKELKQALKALRALESAGVREHGYDLESPFSHKQNPRRPRPTFLWLRMTLV